MGKRRPSGQICRPWSGEGYGAGVRGQFEVNHRQHRLSEFVQARPPVARYSSFKASRSSEAGAAPHSHQSTNPELVFPAGVESDYYSDVAAGGNSAEGVRTSSGHFAQRSAGKVGLEQHRQVAHRAQRIGPGNGNLTAACDSHDVGWFAHRVLRRLSCRQRDRRAVCSVGTAWSLRPPAGWRWPRTRKIARLPGR